MNENYKYLTVYDFAKKYSKTEKTIYNWINSGKISKDRVKKVLKITLIRV